MRRTLSIRPSTIFVYGATPNLRNATLQYIPRNMHTVFALLCFVVVIHWRIFPYPSGLLHWHCGNLTIAPVPAKQPWWIWINTSCEFIYERLHNHNKANHNKLVCIFLGICCICPTAGPSKMWLQLWGAAQPNKFAVYFACKLLFKYFHTLGSLDELAMKLGQNEIVNCMDTLVNKIYFIRCIP